VARGVAASRGRDYVIPDDVKAAAVASLAHRIALSVATDLRDVERLLAEVVRSTPVPA
jgi:MoxR-like ATPase